MTVLLAVDDGRLADALRREGVDVVATIPPIELADAAADRLPGSETAGAVAAADTVLLQVSRDTLTAATVSFCDRAGTRIVALCDTDEAERLAAAFGIVAVVPAGLEAWQVADALAKTPVAASVAPDDTRGRTIVVWGAAGSPGRTTVAVELAIELARGDRHVGLIDADTHAPSMALALGLPDEGPGFASACRQAELGGLDGRELTRISQPLGRGVDVLTGLNRPGRWPELSEQRVTAALAECRHWADYTVVDVAAGLERDEEIMSDLAAPRRNAATLAALASADLVVAVVGADPIGVSRYLRHQPELRTAVGATPIAVVANRLRPGAVGIDARGQVRRTLDRFGAVSDVWFLPHDPRSADAALLAARPIAEVAPRSPFSLALRRFAGEAVAPAPAPARPARRIRRRSAA
ncbi:hypothetical protein GCM10022200_11370 [Microbacterium awajiense]|uniref:CobQ/CobB/MinD/ParA nucleotide binding domain-containing protein n=1 Tax=Microbacterium awajiense TaxID=415214 RepID=A0ABP7AEQ7_9MICO